LQDQLLEPNSGATRQHRRQSFQRTGEKLERVIEDDLLALGDVQLLLQLLADDADLLLLKRFECQREYVAIVSRKLWKKMGFLIVFPIWRLHGL